jgi:hypothetical protein
MVAGGNTIAFPDIYEFDLDDVAFATGLLEVSLLFFYVDLVFSLLYYSPFIISIVGSRSIKCFKSTRPITSW